ncbi:MAG: penicillin-binding protein activator LpoB [Marinilabiliales bacterium]|nr:MAG: penicillin-binding protein activator LpoB [Marinilabiliales bacterium]
MEKLYNIITIVFIVAITFGCAPKRQVQRVETDQTIDLSGRWNDSDSRSVSEEMIKQLLHDNWISDFNIQNSGKRPILIVGLVKNKSHEHIDANTFIKDIEKAIIQDGSARLVQAADKREALRNERVDQQDYASSETAKNWGLELGADYMLQGTINSVVDTYKKEKIIYYQINLELSHLETNEIVWIGEKKIKKYIRN